MSKKDDTKNGKKREFKIPEDARQLAKLKFKKFKKENQDFYDNKKDLKRAYYNKVIDLLPDSIMLLVRYGHLQEVKETKDAIYEKITDKDFIKELSKIIKKGEEIDNIILLPNVIYDIICTIQKEAADKKAENPEAEVSVDLSDLVELSSLILKKKIKKMQKNGVDSAVAFDVLSVIPSSKILAKSQYFHIRGLFNVLYGHAKDKNVEFDKIMNSLFKKGDEYKKSVITFALLERKDKITNFNDTQKKLFNDITEWCFKTLEDMKKDDINDVLKAYVEARKRDEANNKDSNRRFYISSLPEADYKNICKVVAKITTNESMKKYF